jgi:hypothetical protein
VDSSGLYREKERDAGISPFSRLIRYGERSGVMSNKNALNAQVDDAIRVLQMPFDLQRINNKPLFRPTTTPIVCFYIAFKGVDGFSPKKYSNK